MLVCVFIIVVVLVLIGINGNKQKEHMDNLWIRREGCPYTLSKTLQHVLHTYNIQHGTTYSWNLYLPCTYNNIDSEIDAISLLSASPISFTQKDTKSLFII